MNLARLLSLLQVTVFAWLALAGCSEKPGVTAAPALGIDVSTASHANRNVFLIVMENKNWSEIHGSDDAPYINTVLLPMAAYAEQYYNPPNVHPSEPNYLWMEAGTAFGINDDDSPAVNHQGATLHLVTLLERKGISWRTYQEGISGTDCPLVQNANYHPKHNPMVFFDDVTDNNNPQSAYCIQHNRPLSELPSDLRDGTVARYNFIVPDLCHDMHGDSKCIEEEKIRTEPEKIRRGDTWLAENVPLILDSQAWKAGGVLFITWDEGWDEGGYFSDGPIGMIVLSPNAKGDGYSNSIHYTHSSLLLTIQQIFGVMPPLGDAARASDLRDLFEAFP